MSFRTIYAGVTALAVVGILGLAIYMGAFSSLIPTGQASTSGSGTSQSGSIQGANQTVIATQVTSLTSTTATSTYSTSTQSTSTGGSYVYNASSQVKILSLAAKVSGAQSGHRTITFSVQFENVGTGTMYVLSGGGSSLSERITSGGSLVQQVTGPRCEIATAIGPVGPGGDWTAITPGCWSGYSYQLVEAGTIQVQLTLTWSLDSSQGSGGGSVVINAQFTLN